MSTRIEIGAWVEAGAGLPLKSQRTMNLADEANGCLVKKPSTHPDESLSPARRRGSFDSYACLPLTYPAFGLSRTSATPWPDPTHTPSTP